MASGQMGRKMLVGALAALLAVSAASADVMMRTVVLSGEHAPGTEAGVYFTSNIQDVCLNGPGQVAFRANLAGPGVSYGVRDWGAWTEGQGPLNLVARVGDQCPGTPAGVHYSGFHNILLSSAGQVTFQPFSKDSSSGYYYDVILSGGGSLSPIAQKNQPAPGVPVGVTFSTFNYRLYPGGNQLGQAAFYGNVQGPGVDQYNREGIWVMGGGVSRLVARGGDTPAGFGAGVDFWRFSDPYVNGYGQTAFRGLARWSGGMFFGLWSDARGALEPVALSGAPVPGMPAGVTFGIVPDQMGFNDAGQIVFQTDMSGPGIGSLNKEGIWVGDAGGLTLAARDGDPAPGAGGNFLQIGYARPIINGAGAIAFTARISGSVDYGLWRGPPGALDLMARDGWQAPGLSAGVQFDAIVYSAMNNTGALAFGAALRGPGVNTSNDDSLWAVIGSELILVAREGEAIDVRPGVSKTISHIGFYERVGNEEGRPIGFNDAGQLGLVLSFTDGSSGVFVASVSGTGQTTELTPMLPDNTVPELDGAWSYDGVSGGGQWFDPPMADGYVYETDGASNFTQVGPPTGVGDADGLFLVSDTVNGSVTVAAGVIHTFPVPVGRFTITGIDPLVDGADPLAFPTYLAFDQATVNFDQTPIPEPMTAALLPVAALALLRRRRCSKKGRGVGHFAGFSGTT